jgi:hypothetical protein
MLKYIENGVRSRVHKRDKRKKGRSILKGKIKEFPRNVC